MPYPVQWDDNRRLYFFTTESDLTYEISFTEDDHLNIGNEDNPLDNIYHFILAKKEEDKNKKIKDEEVSTTIKDVVTTFFSKNINHTLIYTCDDLDNKGKCRFILFDKWYKSWSVPGYEKIDNVIQLDDGTSIYTSVILHESNINYEIIIERHKSIEQTFKAQ